MFGWFKTTSPLKPNQRHWINQRFDWLRTEFGDDRLRGPVVTPSDEFFPNSYAGTFDDASALFERVCKYMDVDRNRIDLKLYKTPAADATYNAVFPQGYALGRL
jgi:hypothetical protein